MPARVLAERLPSDLGDLLESYPYKAYQLAFQGVGRDALAAYHLGRIERDWHREPREGVWIAAGKGTSGDVEPTGAFCRVTRSGRHSDILGREFYRIQPFLVRQECPKAARDVITVAVGEFGRLGGETLELRIDVSDLDTHHVLERAGFRHLGTSVKLSARKGDLVLPEPLNDPSIGVSDAGEADLGAIGDIVRNSHVTSHYFSRGVFEPARVRDLFADWTKRCVGGLAERVLMAREGDRVLGFATLLVSRGLTEHTGSATGVVDFVAVRPDLQGRGIGSELLRAGLEILGETCALFEVRTELDNFPAIRTYSRLGFRLTSADHVLMLARDRAGSGDAAARVLALDR